MSYYKYIGIIPYFVILVTTGCSPVYPDPADVLVREQQRVDSLASGSCPRNRTGSKRIP